MAYKLIGQNFVPHDVVAKVTGRAKYAEDFRADGMVFCKLLTSPMPHAKIRSIDAVGGAEDAGRARHPDRRRRAAVPAAAAADPRQGRGVLSSASRSWRSRPWTRHTAADAIEKIKIDFEQLPHVVDPLDSLYPGRPERARPTAMSRPAQINLQTVKWQAGDFADDGKTCRWASRPKSGAMAISMPASRPPS